MSSSSLWKGNLSLLNFRANLLQCLPNLLALIGGDQPDFGKHLSMCDRSGNILGVQPAVKAHAFGKLLDPAIRRLAKNSTPCFFSHYYFSINKYNLIAKSPTHLL